MDLPDPISDNLKDAQCQKWDFYFIIFMIDWPAGMVGLWIPHAPPSSCLLEGVNRFDLRRDFRDDVGVELGVAPSFSSFDKLEMLEADAKLFVSQEGTTKLTSEQPDTKDTAELKTKSLCEIEYMHNFRIFFQFTWLILKCQCYWIQALEQLEVVLQSLLLLALLWQIPRFVTDTSKGKSCCVFHVEDNFPWKHLINN